MTDLWSGYREAVFDTFPDLKFESNHATWENKRGTKLTADLYSGKYFLKSRHVDIWAVSYTHLTLPTSDLV